MNRKPSLNLVLGCLSLALVAGAVLAADHQAEGGRFDYIRLGLSTAPPAVCVAAVYGTITARAPDGALCFCHQSYDGKQGFWEQIGTGRPCWPDKK